MPARISHLPVVAVLAVVIAAGFIFRNWFSDDIMPAPERMQAETTQAYRYARMFSSEGSIPGVDTLVMHPEGMQTSQNSIFEEYIAGGIHRITGGDFNEYIRIFCLIFPLFSIPFLFLWMRSAGLGLFEALAGSSLYAFLLPALLRARGESFYRETVALPVLIALGWLVEKALSRAGDDRAVPEGRITVSISAGVAFFIALAAWKVTSFIAFFLLLYLIWRNWKRADVPLELRIALSSAQISASLLLSHMRHDGALFSPATVLAVFLLLPRCKSVWIPISGTVASVLAAFAGTGASGHVSSVIAAKLRFMFSHPSDPSLLSDDARLFWVPGYTSPSPAQILLLFGIPMIAALSGVTSFIREKKNTLIFWFLFISLAGYLFFDRLMVFLAVAIIPVLAMSMRKKWLRLPLIMLIILQSVFVVHIAGGIMKTGLEFRDSSSLLTDRELDSFLYWVEHETDSDEAILCYWHISGLVSAYAERPVVTHTFFENEDNRRTIVQFARMMFMPEDSIIAFMREKKCELVVYQADILLDRSYSGLLYLAGHSNVPLNSVAQDMQYHPERLDSLNLVFQGPSLRVFRLGKSSESSLPRQFLFVERYRHFYDGYDSARAIMADPVGYSEYLANESLELHDPDMLSAALLLGVSSGGTQSVTEQMLNGLIQLYIQGDYDLDRLAEDVDTFTRWCGSRPQLRLLLARLYAAENRTVEAEVEYRRVLEEDPGNTEAEAELRTLNEKIQE